MNVGCLLGSSNSSVKYAYKYMCAYVLYILFQMLKLSVFSLGTFWSCNEPVFHWFQGSESKTIQKILISSKYEITIS